MKPTSRHQRRRQRRAFQADAKQRARQKRQQQAATEATAETEPWQPLKPANAINDNMTGQVLQDHDEIWMNNLYTVHLTRNVLHSDAQNHPQMHELSIRRNDRQAAMDWRHLQQIKNELIGERHEGTMLFPHANRLVDTSNQFYMYVCAVPDIIFPYGMLGRLVSEGGGADVGNVQRPFQPGLRPDDVKTSKDLEAITQAVVADAAVAQSQGIRLKRVTRTGPVTPEQAARDKAVRDAVADELPDLAQRHYERQGA